MVYQYQRPSPRPVASAHIAQTMTLLGLPLEELRQKIDTELGANPALELVEERNCPSCQRRLNKGSLCPRCSAPDGLSANEPIVFVSQGENFGSSPIPKEDLPGDKFAFTADTEDLSTYVFQQIASELSQEDRPIAAHVLTNLDEDGLMTTPILEIARYQHVSLARVEKVIQIIQHAEPLGVGSPSPQAALLLQLEVLSRTTRVPPHAKQAIEEGIKLLSRRQYTELGQKLGISGAQAKKVAKFISENLNPYPGRAHWGSVRHKPQPAPETYHRPDLIITRLNDSLDTPLVIEVMWPVFGTLRVNPLFRKTIQDAPAEKLEQWKSDLEQASLFIKCLRQRNNTIVRLMQLLAIHQRDFILYGDTQSKPTTRVQFAHALDVHESTVSRAVSNKSIQLPSNRIVPLARFFDRSLHVRAHLKNIIAQETIPLSDTKLAAMLTEIGFPVKRRTVNKYRSLEGILATHLRRPPPTMKT